MGDCVLTMDIRSAEIWQSLRWGNFQLDATQKLPEQWNSGTHKKFKFLCSCGRVCESQFLTVFSGRSKSCGKCSYGSKSHWLSQTWGSLRLDPNQNLPAEWAPNSNLNFNFICACGRSCKKPFYKIGDSCGCCAYQDYKYWLSQTWGKLCLNPNQSLPVEWGEGSYSLFEFNCSCGRTLRVKFDSVTSGNAKSCGRCTFLSKEYWLAQTWGKLRLDPDQELPDEWGPSSDKIFNFLCSCGKPYLTKFSGVRKGHSSCCAKCNSQPRSLWLERTWGKLRLDPNQPLPEEWSKGSDVKFLFNCECGNSSHILFRSVSTGITRSCGCGCTGQSDFSKENEVRIFVKSLTECVSPKSVSIPGTRRSYDVYVPPLKVAIEHHGLVWHGQKYNTKPLGDHEKYLLACSQGDRLIQIYSDEWRDKQEIIKTYLKELIAPGPKKRIQPVYESIQGRTPAEARDFLDAHHYLGAAGGCLTIVAKHKDEIVGCWVFMKRESGTVLWHRACWDHTYKTWNPHERALKMALPLLKQMGFTRMVTFSDNRFHTGGLYEKLGFTFEKELKPDYGYTDGKTRVSKYALRVKAGIDEQSFAAVKGWYRIWDSGKRRYSLTL